MQEGSEAKHSPPHPTQSMEFIFPKIWVVLRCSKGQCQEALWEEHRTYCSLFLRFWTPQRRHRHPANKVSGPGTRACCIERPGSLALELVTNPWFCSAHVVLARAIASGKPVPTMPVDEDDRPKCLRAFVPCYRFGIQETFQVMMIQRGCCLVDKMCL